MSRTTGSGPVLCLNSVNPIKKQTQNRSVILCVTAVGKFSCLVSFLISPSGSFSHFTIWIIPNFLACYTYITIIYSVLYYPRLSAYLWVQFAPKHHNRSWLPGTAWKVVNYQFCVHSESLCIQAVLKNKGAHTKYSFQTKCALFLPCILFYFHVC